MTLFPPRFLRRLFATALLGCLAFFASAGLAARAAERTFEHPGGLHTTADLERMKARVAERASPWFQSWGKLLQDPLARHDYRPSPQGNLGVSRQRASRDAHAAYLNFIRWYVSGDERHADAAIRILNAWTDKVDQVPTGTDIPGLSGIPIAEFAIVGELLRVCPRWKPADFERFRTMVRTYLYPVCHDFLVRHNGACVSHYWANWDIANVGALLAIGVLCDDAAIFDEGLAYHERGAGMGALPHAIPFFHPDGLGQWQESGRDQDHAQLGVGMMAQTCQIAWNQGIDLFALDDNRLLSGAEYVARYNLWLDAPYSFYNNCSGAKNFWPSVNGRGRIDERPLWELVYNHYVVRRGLAAPHVAAMAALTRPEHGSKDHFGYGTLTFTLDAAASPWPPASVPAAPAGLVATPGVGRIDLSWRADPTLVSQGYVVRRARSALGPYEEIASWNARTNPDYTDRKAEPGVTYYYVVAAQNQAGVGPDSAPVSAVAGSTEPPPAGWALHAIGAATTSADTKDKPGFDYATVGTRAFFITGAGKSIDGATDATTFVGRAVTGDFTLIARLSQAASAQAGLMMRESAAPGARSVALTLGEVGGRQTRFRARATPGGPTVRQSGNDYTWTPVWYRLARVGDVFTAAHSADGETWFEVGSATVRMPAAYQVGFAVCSRNAATPGTATFDHVSAILPAPSRATRASPRLHHVR